LKNPEFDILIEKIRSSHNLEERKKDLLLLEEHFKKTIPAIYLYSPIFYYQISEDVK
jgi:ABC-type oligopeptide transport system substrate-binding subunit